MTGFRFLGTCVSLDDGPAITAMRETGRPVSYRTFRRRCPELSRIARVLGYGSDTGVSLAHDWAVSFWRGFFRDERCYWLDWSRIEFVFVGGRP